MICLLDTGTNSRLIYNEKSLAVALTQFNSKLDKKTHATITIIIREWRSDYLVCINRS